MTGRQGGVRNVSFPILTDDRATAATKPETDSQNALVIFRQLWRDACTVADKIRHLGEDEPGYHGDLQVLLSTLRRMVQKVERLIAQTEGFKA
jgi:hypothetical protein